MAPPMGPPALGSFPIAPAPPPPPPPRSRGRHLRLIALVLIAGLAGLLGGSAWNRRVSLIPINQAPAVAPAESTESTDAPPTTRAAYEGVVEITTIAGRSIGAGTGMLLDDTGRVLTNYHVIEGARTIRVQIGGTGKYYTAKVVGSNPTRDVAVLDIDISSDDVDPIALGDSSSVRLGDDVTAVGNARGRPGPPTVATGDIIGVNRTVTARGDDGTSETLYGMLETNAQIQPGDSGGPLFDADGNVIGMITAGSAGSRRFMGATTGFAIPINTALRVVAQINASSTTPQ